MPSTCSSSPLWSTATSVVRTTLGLWPSVGCFSRSAPAELEQRHLCSAPAASDRQEGIGRAAHLGQTRLVCGHVTGERLDFEEIACLAKEVAKVEPRQRVDEP